MAKKEKHCDRTDPADDPCGDCWDAVLPELALPDPPERDRSDRKTA